MEQYTIIKDIVIILSVSLVIIFLFRKFNLPSIIGFLLAGIIIGPYGTRLITEVEQIEVMAEIGVILLLFTIGLEVSFKTLLRMKKFLFLSGGLQVVLTILFTSVISYFFGISIKVSIFLGMLVSLSSTAIVLKILSDKNELEAPHGKISLGILIFQDLAVVPMFLALPILGAEANSSFTDIMLRVGFAFAAVTVIFAVARFFMPVVLYQLARLRLREAFTVGVILLLLGTAYLTHAIGLSFALGAFIAGLILSESEFNSQVVADILPLKDAFNSIFFVSVGMLLNLSFVISYPLMLLTITVGLILLKALIIAVIVKMMKYPLRIAVLCGLGLAQIGEFSFILAQAGLNYNLIEASFYNAFLASSIFTMFLTPFMLQLAPYIAGGAGNLEHVKTGLKSKQVKLKDHVIIVGFGLNGKNLARVLKETGINYAVLDLNPDTVKAESEKGENIFFGDSTKEEVLNTAQIKDAKVIVFAISDPLSSRRGLQLAKKMNPNIYTIVRTRFITEIDDLMHLEADEVIPEEFETSLQIFAKVLEKFHIPLNVIMKQVSLLRGESYSLMRKDTSDIQSFVHLNEILAAGLTDTFYVSEENKYSGKTLAQINLRAATDATIIAVVRGNKTISNPSGKEMIYANDTLVITGTHQSVDKAFEFLDAKD
jgi:monovalent cation:H+ antiporter-2, CPA2 family